MYKFLKNFKKFSINENLDIDNYLDQLNDDTRYLSITKKLYNEIEKEGWVEQLEDFYNKTLNKFNFKYMILNLNYTSQRSGRLSRKVLIRLYNFIATFPNKPEPITKMYAMIIVIITIVPRL